MPLESITSSGVVTRARVYDCYTVLMAYNDEQLRTLSSWLPGLKDLQRIEKEVSIVWARLKELRAQAEQAKRDLRASCPLTLDDLEFRFWTKVGIVDDDDACWEWNGARSPEPDNYGSFRWFHPRTGISTVSPSSAVAMFLTDGCLPAGQGNHHCDNPPCSRSKHLYDGTHAQNMRDKTQRGRGRTRNQSGAQNAQAKLTDALVIQARKMARQQMMTWQIHEAIGSVVSETVLRWAITGRTWKHLDSIEPPVIKPQNGSAIRGKKVPRRADR